MFWCLVEWHFPSLLIHQRLKSSRSTATARYAINFAKWCNMCEFKVIAFFIMQIFCCQLIAFSKLKVLYFTQQCNTKKAYSTEEQRHRSCAFFPSAKKNCKCAFDYLASERMKFVCAVNTYVSGTVKLLPTSPTIKTEVSKYHDWSLIKSGRCLTFPDSQYLYHIKFSFVWKFATVGKQLKRQLSGIYPTYKNQV